MRSDHPQRTASARSLAISLTAVFSGLILVLGGALFFSTAQAAQPADQGSNVTVASNACGEVTFTGVNSDSTITVTIEGGGTFDVPYKESVTIETQLDPVNYSTTTNWDDDNWVETGSIDVKSCNVKKPRKPKAKKPTVAPAAGR